MHALCALAGLQAIVNVLRRMPNNVALERLSDLRYHSFKQGDNARAVIVAALGGKPK